jgi:hypothetical protein
MNETYIEVTIKEYGRKVFVSEVFTGEDPVTIDMLEDVFHDALRGAGFHPRGE